MAIQSNFPAIRPSLLLDFANSKRLDPRITFTRASTARYYDGSTVAKAEENLFLRSQEFDNAVWSGTITVTANQTTAPDGTSTADLLAEVVATGNQNLNQGGTSAISITSGLPYTLSAFLKKGSGATAPDWMQLSFASGQFGASQYANFNLTTGAVGTVGAGTTASIVNVGSGWYRCIITVTATSSLTGSLGGNIIFTNNNDGLGRLPSYAGATTSDVFVWGAQLEQRSAVTAYTATTTAPITNYVPVLQTAQNGVPRFDHNPTTGESLGLLIEEQRTNLVTYSEDFSNAAWNKVQASIIANAIVAPDGTLTADQFVENTASSTAHSVTQTFTASALTYVYSAYIKPNGRTNIQIYIRETATSGTEFATRTFDFTNPSNTANSSMENVGNGWYRVAVWGAVTAGTRSCTMRPVVGGTSNYTGDGYSGFYVWGAQLEAGAFPTSYIPTVAASATRQADAASMTGTNFSSWYDAAEGTAYVEAASPVSGARASFGISNNTSSNRMTAYADGANGAWNIATNGTSQAYITSGTVTANVMRRSAYVYKVNDIAVVANGGSVATDTSALIPVVDRMYIGADETGGARLNGPISKLAYYPARLTNAQLQAITG